MSFLNAPSPVTKILANQKVAVYMCPPDKNFALMKVEVFYDMLESKPTPAYFNIYLSKEATEPKDEDMIIHNVALGIKEVSPTLDMINVGAGERIYVELLSGTTGVANVRVSGTESSETFVVKSGTLGKLKIPSSGQHNIYKFANAYAKSATGTLSIQTRDKPATVYVKVGEVGKTMTNAKIVLQAKETALVSGIKVKQGYQVDVQTTVAGVVCAFVGTEKNF